MSPPGWVIGTVVILVLAIGLTLFFVTGMSAGDYRDGAEALP